jgi:hypothetical protein
MEKTLMSLVIQNKHSEDRENRDPSPKLQLQLLPRNLKAKKSHPMEKTSTSQVILNKLSEDRVSKDQSQKLQLPLL